MSKEAQILIKQFVQVRDTDSDALVVLYSHLRVLSLEDLKWFIMQYLSHKPRPPHQKQLYAVLSDYYWSAIIARLFLWPYFAHSKIFRLEQQYAWHPVGTHFAASYAHLGLYMLQGLCSQSLIFSQYDATKPVQNEVAKFYTWIQAPFDHRQPLRWLLDQAFFSILQTAYETHLLHLHRHFGLSRDNDPGRVDIWNQAFDGYVDCLMLHIRQWVSKRQEELSQTEDAFGILQDIPNKIQWYMLGQLHNHIPRLLAQHHTRIPMIETSFIQLIADEMTMLEWPVIHVLSYFDPLICTTSKRPLDMPCSLLYVMLRTYKANHPEDNHISSVAATHRLFFCIYNSRESALREINTSLLSDFTIDDNDSLYKDIQSLLSKLQSVYMAGDHMPSIRDQTFWSSSYLNVDLFCAAMEHTGRGWREELMSNQSTLRLSKSIYAAMQLASKWPIEETRFPLISKAINAIHNEGKFFIWFQAVNRQSQQNDMHTNAASSLIFFKPPERIEKGTNVRVTYESVSSKKRRISDSISVGTMRYESTFEELPYVTRRLGTRLVRIKKL